MCEEYKNHFATLKRLRSEKCQSLRRIVIFFLKASLRKIWTIAVNNKICPDLIHCFHLIIDLAVNQSSSCKTKS